MAEGDFSIESGYRGARRLLAERVTAIFAGNDEMALGVSKAATEAGLRIPEDLSLVGFDDNPIAKVMPVPLTTILQPGETMGEKACEVLLDRLSNPDEEREPQDFLFDPVLITRRSVCPPAGKNC